MASPMHSTNTSRTIFEPPRRQGRQEGYQEREREPISSRFLRVSWRPWRLGGSILIRWRGEPSGREIAARGGAGRGPDAGDDGAVLHDDAGGHGRGGGQNRA